MEQLKSILLISSFILPLVLSITVFVEAKGNKSKKIMAMTLLFASFVFMGFYLFDLKLFKIYIPMHSLNSALQYAIFPSIYLYIKSIVMHDDNIIKNNWLHFAPSIIDFVLASYLFYFFITPSQLEYFLTNNRLNADFAENKYFLLKNIRYMHLMLVLVQASIYSYAFFKIPKEYDEKLRNEFSNIEHFSLKWIHKYNISFVSLILIGFAIYGVTPLKGYFELLSVSAFFLFSIYVCIMGWISLKQKSTDINLDITDKTVNVVSKTHTTEKIQLFNRLKVYLEVQQAYLQPDLSLTDLSTALGTNRTYLSTVINEETNMNFCCFINDYRVKHANDYMKEHPTITKEELCLIAGFGSVRSMQRSLQKIKVVNGM